MRLQTAPELPVFHEYSCIPNAHQSEQAATLRNNPSTRIGHHLLAFHAIKTGNLGLTGAANSYKSAEKGLYYLKLRRKSSPRSIDKKISGPVANQRRPMVESSRVGITKRKYNFPEFIDIAEATLPLHRSQIVRINRNVPIGISRIRRCNKPALFIDPAATVDRTEHSLYREKNSYRPQISPESSYRKP